MWPLSSPLFASVRARPGRLGPIVAAAGWCGWRLTRPYQAFGAETFVEFPRGTGSRALAAALAQAGVIRSRGGFLLARALSPSRVLQIGRASRRQRGKISVGA